MNAAIQVNEAGAAVRDCPSCCPRIVGILGLVPSVNGVGQLLDTLGRDFLPLKELTCQYPPVCGTLLQDSVTLPTFWGKYWGLRRYNVMEFEL